MIYNNNNFNKEPVNYMKNSSYKFTSNSYFQKNKDMTVIENNNDLIKRIPKITINHKLSNVKNIN